MDKHLYKVKSVWLFLALWSVALLLSPFEEGASTSSIRLLTLVGFLLFWLAYPLFLVFASAVTKVTRPLRLFVAVSFAAFIIALILRPLNEPNSVTDQWYSAIGGIAMLCVQFGAVRAITGAERQRGIYPLWGGFGAWLSLFSFPFFGVFFIHNRYKRLVEHAADSSAPLITEQFQKQGNQPDTFQAETSDKDFEGEMKYTGDLIEVFETLDQSEILIVKSVLDEERITYHFSGDFFGMSGILVSPARLFVPNDAKGRVLAILKEFQIGV
jgi:hypothetical protein